jgi:hypothetical protein
MATARELLEEDRRVRFVRMIVNLTCAAIMQGNLSRSEAEALVEGTRGRILQLFPGREETYELLYARRFRRLIDEHTHPTPLAPVPSWIM